MKKKGKKESKKERKYSYEEYLIRRRKHTHLEARILCGPKPKSPTYLHIKLGPNVSQLQRPNSTWGMTI